MFNLIGKIPFIFIKRLFILGTMLGGCLLLLMSNTLANTVVLNPYKAKSVDSGILSIESLTKVFDQQDWVEVLSKLDLIPLPLRNDQWDRYLNTSGLELLKILAEHKVPTEGYLRCEDLLIRYPELMKNQDFMRLRGEIGLRSLANCFKNPGRADFCVEKTEKLYTKDSQSKELAFELGKLLRKNSREKLALKYFDAALDKSSPSQFCNDEDLKLSVMNAFGLPNGKNDSNGELLKIAVRIASGACWNVWNETLAELFEKDRRHYQHNMCHFMREKRAITAQQAHFCR